MLPSICLRDPERQVLTRVLRPTSPEMPGAQEPDARYQMHGEIARGGMGAILQGRDVDLGRDVALKVLLEAHRDRAELVERFVEEAQIGGQLQHPGIVPVYDLGRFPDGRPFFAMKLVKGQTLAKLLLDRTDLSPDRTKLLKIFEQMCNTLAYAHARGVIHRDIKPSNVMVGSFGEVLVMDWGLAKVLSEGGIADEKKALAATLGFARTGPSSRPTMWVLRRVQAASWGHWPIFPPSRPSVRSTRSMRVAMCLAWERFSVKS